MAGPQALESVGQVVGKIIGEAIESDNFKLKWTIDTNYSRVHILRRNLDPRS